MSIATTLKRSRGRPVRAACNGFARQSMTATRSHRSFPPWRNDHRKRDRAHPRQRRLSRPQRHRSPTGSGSSPPGDTGPSSNRCDAARPSSQPSATSRPGTDGPQLPRRPAGRCRQCHLDAAGYNSPCCSPSSSSFSGCSFAALQNRTQPSQPHRLHFIDRPSKSSAGERDFKRFVSLSPTIAFACDSV